MDRIMLRDDKNLLTNSGYMFLNNHLIKKPPVQKIFLNFHRWFLLLLVVRTLSNLRYYLAYRIA